MVKKDNSLWWGEGREMGGGEWALPGVALLLFFFLTT